MSTTVSVVTSTSTPSVTSVAPSSPKSGTAKLLIQSDGRIRLKANSQDFPTPGIKDNHKLYASYNKSGTMNVYYSPTGNTSEVYLLRPKDITGQEKHNSTGESIISNLFLKHNTKTGDVADMPTITVVNDRKGLKSVKENKISLLKQSKSNKDEIVVSSQGSSRNIRNLKSVVPSTVSTAKGRAKCAVVFSKAKVSTFPDKGGRSPSPDPEECLAALPNMDIGKTIAAILKDTEKKDSNPSTIKQLKQTTQSTNSNVTLSATNQLLHPTFLKTSQNIPSKKVVYPTASVTPSTNNLTISTSQKIQSLLAKMENENASTSAPLAIKSAAVSDRSSFKENSNNSGSENDSSSMGIRIDSIFSLADVSNKGGDKETASKEDPVNKAKSLKKMPKLGPKSYKILMQMKTLQCKPCFVVLERTSTHRPRKTKKRKAKMLQVKCSDHCRKRTLNSLCRLGLLDCKNSKQNDQLCDARKSTHEVVPVKEVEKMGVKIPPKVIKASELFPAIEPKPNNSYHKNQNRLVISNSDNDATKATLIKPVLVSSGSKNTSTTPATPLISKISQPISMSQSSALTIPTSQMTNQLSNISTMPRTVSLPQTTLTQTLSSHVNTQVVFSNSNSLKQQITGGNNKYILVNVAGKNVLIPAVIKGKSTDNAFVINPNKDGTSVLLPAKITYNKMSSGQNTTTTATTTMSKPSNVSASSTLISYAVPQAPISSKAHPSGLVEMSNDTHPVSDTKTVTSDSIKLTAQDLVKSLQNYRGTSLQTIGQNKPSTTATTTVSSSSNNNCAVDAATKKRKKTLAERYPLPPGVFIKKEPVTSGYGDEESEIPPTNKITKTQDAPALTSKDVTKAICNMINSKKKTPNNNMDKPPLNVNFTNNGRFITVRLPNSSTPEIRLLPTQNLVPPPSYTTAKQKTSKNQPVIRIVPNSNISTPVSSVSSTPAPVVIRTVPPPNLGQQPSYPPIPIAEPTVTFAASSQSWSEPQPFLGMNDEVEEVIDPPSPGPPDLGEPQVILSSIEIRNCEQMADSNIDKTESIAAQSQTKSTPKTEQEKRIEKLRKMLREREEALEEMRRKKATEEPIDFDDDL